MIRLYTTECGKRDEHETGLALTRYAVRDTFDITPVIAYAASGRPYVANSSGIFISISHSCGVCLAAVSDHELGADIEARRRSSEQLKRLAVRFFSPDEAEYAIAAPLERFYDVWTAKESYIKYTGEGLSRPLPSFSVLSSSLSFTHYRTAAHTICVCSDGERAPCPQYIDKKIISNTLSEENS